MAQQSENFTTPVGRLVNGSLYKGNDKDAEGKPLQVKTGPNTGQPRLDYYFALAIPKGTEQHWAQTEWGGKIWQRAHVAYPSAQANPKFSWKVTDGDSQVPNGKGKKPCDRDGWRGCWVLHISSGFVPRIVRARPGSNPPAFDAFNDPDAIKLGHFVQVNINCDYNGSSQQPGVYLNHSMVCFSAFGPEIFVGPDATQMGFGGALPAGASLTPPASAFPVPGAAVPGMAPMPAPPAAMPAAPAPAPAMAPPVAMPAPIPVHPNPGFAQIPGMPPAPAPMMAPPPPPPPAMHQMTAAAQGATYESFIAQGWNDVALRQQGYMV